LYLDSIKVIIIPVFYIDSTSSLAQSLTGRSGINVVRQVGGLAVARWRLMRRKPMRRRLMRRTGKFGAVAGGAVRK